MPFLLIWVLKQHSRPLGPLHRQKLVDGLEGARPHRAPVDVALLHHGTQRPYHDALFSSRAMCAVCPVSSMVGLSFRRPPCGAASPLLFNGYTKHERRPGPTGNNYIVAHFKLYHVAPEIPSHELIVYSRP